MKTVDWSLYLVTDSSQLRGLNLIEMVDKSVAGGVTVVQLREKHLSDPERKELALALLKILRPKKIPLILNDSPKLAKEVRADGVHLGKNDLSVREARQIFGQDFVVGLSVESIDRLEEMDLEGIDYLAASPVFPTLSKSDLPDPFLLSGLNRLKSRVSLPLIAIGGIQESNVQQVIAAGADGVAVISAIAQSEDPERTSRRLKTLIDETKSLKQNFRKFIPRVLTIAGSDSGGGAGIQADLKTFEALDCYGMSAITALTSQNTMKVVSIAPSSVNFVKEQIECVVEDIGVSAVKIGMLFSKEMIEAVSDLALKHSFPNLVLDPVMISKTGNALLQEEAISTLKERLAPLANILTPNLPEAELMLGRRIQTQIECEDAMADLLEISKAVVLKGGHGDDPIGVKDYFKDRSGNSFTLTEERIDTPHTHGTGCTFSSAIAAYLAQGLSLPDAVSAARKYLQGAIKAGAFRKIGHGNGPVHHSWRLK